VHDDRTPLDRLSPEELPRLALFLAQYLDRPDGGKRPSAAEAAYTYVTEAELDELQELARDWDVLRAAAGDRPLDEVNRALHARFSCEWSAASRDEIEAVAAEFERALRE